MRTAVSCLLALYVTAQSGAVLADDAPKPGAATPGTSVEMPYLMAPLSDDEKLLGYAYISSKVVASSLSAAIDIRAKLPFIQDAFVRDVNANPVTKPGSPTTVDTTGLVIRLLADAKRIVGSDKVSNVKIVQVQISPLKPSGSTVSPGP